MEGIKIDTFFDKIHFLLFAKNGVYSKWIFIILWALSICSMYYGRQYNTITKEQRKFLIFSFAKCKLFDYLSNKFFQLEYSYQIGYYSTIPLDDKQCYGYYTSNNTVICIIKDKFKLFFFWSAIFTLTFILSFYLFSM